jgi:hypothetical protein
LLDEEQQRQSERLIKARAGAMPGRGKGGLGSGLQGGSTPDHNSAFALCPALFAMQALSFFRG